MIIINESTSWVGGTKVPFWSFAWTVMQPLMRQMKFKKKGFGNGMRYIFSQDATLQSSVWSYCKDQNDDNSAICPRRTDHIALKSKVSKFCREKNGGGISL